MIKRMKIIRKTISLEPFKSRVPSIIDSVEHVGDTFNEILPRIKNGDLPNGNYSLCPSDIEIPLDIASSITFPTNISVLIPNINGGYENITFDSEPYHYVDESGITEIYYNDVRKKYLSFGGLMKWYKWFNDYYYLLNHPTCRNHTYSSISEYEKVELNDYITDDFREYTEQYDAMGGEKMYNFIVEKCIPRLEFSGNTKMVDYWGTSYLYYPQCITWYGWFSERHDKYGSFDDVSSCTNSIDCCDCKEYFDRGGNDMYEMLKNFIENVEPCNAEIGEASITVPILITRSIDDMGEFSILCNEYELGKTYISGVSPNLAVIDGDVKYLTSGIGFQYDTCFSEMTFDEDAWESYINKIKRSDIVTDSVISGTTSSKLDLFENKTVSFDDIGNRLDFAINVPRNTFLWGNDPNYTLDTSTPYTFNIRPNTTLPLPYIVGGVNHLEFIEEKNNIEYYFGNILTDIIFSVVDISGNTHSASAKQHNGDTIIAINSLGSELISGNVLTATFNYNIGCIIEKSKDPNERLDWYPYSASTEHHNGVEYTETRTLIRKKGKYNIDSKRQAFVYYYITLPFVIKTKASDYGGENKFETPIANFKVEPIKENDTYFDKYNGFTLSPITKEEYKFGSSSFEKVEGNIYIERGNAASFEKHLKLMEINSLEALEQYSNGNVFKINNDSK